MIAWLTALVAAQHADTVRDDGLPVWLSITMGVLGVVLGGGVQWGITTARLSRLEKDVDAGASKESVAALSRRVDDNHDGIKEALGEVKSAIGETKSAVDGLRADLARRTDNTNPGRH